MSEQQEIGPLVTAVFCAWDKAGIDFLVLRNYEGLPEFTSNDIDVLVAPGQLRSAEQALLGAAEEAGFRLHNRARFATLALYLSHRHSNAQAHFDLFTALKWRGFEFLACREFLRRRVNRGLFAIPHPVDEAASNLLGFLIYTRKVKPKYRTSIAAGFRPEPALATALLAETCGQAHAKFLVAAGAREDWAAIEKATGALRRALILRQLIRHPWRTIRSLLSDAWRLAGRFLNPPGLTVVLCGADGCGKSTAARAIVDGLCCTFSPVKGRHFHWKPPLFTARRRAGRGPATDPHGQSVRNPVASLCYFAFHWLEFVVGSHLCFQPAMFRGGLVLVDRYYYDFFVDQRRYRLQVPQWIVRVGYVPLRKPDLVLLLDAPAEVLQGRKREVPLAETERQCRAYRAMVQSLSNGRVINAAQSVEKVGADINQAILDFMAQRAQERWPKQTGSVPVTTATGEASH